MTDVATPTEPSSGDAPRQSSSTARMLASIGVDDWRAAILLPGLALVTALLLSALVIAFSDVDNLRLLGSEPTTAVGNIISTVGDAYWALLRGSVGSLRAISETLTNATPYILAGLAVGLGFRAGLFNIGAQGQMIAGGLASVWVGFTFTGLPLLLHLPLALLGGLIGGAIYGGIPGVLRAKTGAHEVITTIMLNSIALRGADYLLKTEAFQAEGRSDPISEAVDGSARLPRLLGFLDRSDLRVHLGLVVALAAAAGVHWLLFHSTVGFEFRAVGANPAGARYAGMNVVLLTVGVLAVAGAIAGLAGANEVLGVQGRVAPGFVGLIGFDAISVALLGRSHPGGIVAAGLLFGALKAGAQTMQVATDVPIDLIQIIQALIVIFIAAPAVIRAIYRVPTGQAKEVRQITTGWGA